MVKVIMNFEVEDWDKWHAAFLANSKMREENDIKEIYVGHELENKNKCPKNSFPPPFFCV